MHKWGDSGTGVFPWIFAKFLRATFLQDTSGRLLLLKLALGLRYGRPNYHSYFPMNVCQEFFPLKFLKIIKEYVYIRYVPLRLKKRVTGFNGKKKRVSYRNNLSDDFVIYEIMPGHSNFLNLIVIIPK